MNTTTTTGNDTGEPKINGRPRRPMPGERERILAEWATSGMPVDEMAAQTGWSPYTLYRWRLDAGGGKAPKGARPSKAKLLAVPRPTSLATGVWAAEVAMSSGISVRLSAGSAPAWIAQLVRELKSC